MTVASSSRRAALILLLSGLAIPAWAVGHAITHDHLEHAHGGEVNPGHHALPGHPLVHGRAALEADHSHRHSHPEFSATKDGGPAGLPWVRQGVTSLAAGIGRALRAKFGRRSSRLGSTLPELGPIFSVPLRRARSKKVI